MNNFYLKKNIYKSKPKTFDPVLQRLESYASLKTTYKGGSARLKIVMEIRKIRTEQGLTQKMLGEKVQMPQSAIARIESGKSPISLVTLIRIAHALGREVQLV